MAERLTDTMVPDPPSDELLAKTGLTRVEYEDACAKLRRKPNIVEMGIFGAMWSEHCCYKSSKRHLRKFPVEGKRVLQGPGENAGVMDLGNDYAVVFKIESHNHPSAVEPFQGAATGVGGIIRDIFAMGARPIGLMNSLRFGNLTAVPAVGLPPAEAAKQSADLAELRRRVEEEALAQAKGQSNAIPWTADPAPLVYSLAWMTNLRRPLFARGPLARKAVQIIKGLHGDMAEILGYCLLPDQVVLVAQFPDGDETSPAALVSVLKAELGQLAADQVPPGKPLWETGFREHRKHDQQELDESIRRLEYTPVQRGFVKQVKDYPHVSQVWKYGVPWIEDSAELGNEPLTLPYCNGVSSEQAARNRFLLNGVVSGIAHYGNCIGIPTVGGEVCFDPSYTNNCLVNAMCIGIARKDGLLKGIAGQEGNTALIVGAKTGRDGVQGATFASVDLPENYATERPAVQVGDPFMEKLLLEATLEILNIDGLIGLQDFGAAGLTCSSVEMAARSQAGMQLDLDKVPQRAKDLSAYEMMLSESQERMMVVVTPGKEQPFIDAFRKWGLTAVPCGEVLGNTQLKVIHNGELVADLPNGPLANEAPDYNRPYSEPEYYTTRMQAGDREVADAVERVLAQASPAGLDPGLSGGTMLLDVLTRLLAWPAIASKELVYQQYDYMVRTNTLMGPGASDAAVLRVKETGQGLAMATDGSGRHVQLDPRLGGARAVLESARNVLASGATPLGVTNCLNFGNPEKEDRMWQFVECIEGMGTALRELELPITGGNVSLYNETAGRPILPTPVIGMVGLLEDANRCIPSRADEEGLDLYLLGKLDGRLDGSTLLFELGRYRAGELAEHDYRAFRACERYLLAAGEQGALAACHDVSDGGLLVAVLELSPGGAELELGKQLTEVYDNDEFNQLGTLFSEEGHQWVLAVPEQKRSWVRTAALHYGVPLALLGRTASGRLKVTAGPETWLDCPAGPLAEIYKQALPRAMGR